MVIKDKEKARYLMPSLPQYLTGRPVVPSAQPLELEDSEWNESHIIQEEIDGHLLHHFNTCKFIRPDGIHSRVLREWKHLPRHFPSFNIGPG